MDTLEIALRSGVLGLIQDGTPLQPEDALGELQAFREECEKPLQNAIAHYKNDQFCAADTEKRLRTQLAEAQARNKVLEDAFIGEKWAVWYDGTGGYTPAYCHSGNAVTLYNSEEEAVKSYAHVFGVMRGGYHARKVVIHEALSTTSPTEALDRVERT